MIDNLMRHIEQSTNIKIEGKGLSQQSLENYITEVLDMILIKSEVIEDEHAFKERFKFTVKSKKEGLDSEYIFTSDYYDSSWFTPREDALTLIEIKGEEGVHELGEMFYFTSMREESNKNHRLLNTPLSKIISGVIEDPEIDFVIQYLKEVFKGKFGYKYSERNKGNQSTFSMELNDEIVIERGFSNTIQVGFKKGDFRSLQFIFKEVDEKK